MATGRTVAKYTRLYAGGYDLSSDTQTVGPLAWEFDTSDVAAMSHAAKGVLPGHASISMGAWNGWLDNTATSGLHTLHATPATSVISTVAIGVRAAPAAGDSVFVGEWTQFDYMVAPAVGGDIVPATITWGQPTSASNAATYAKPWGHLLHASGAETGANAGSANHDNGAATTAGGFGVLHVLAGNGTATFAIEHSATDFGAEGAIITFATTDASSPFSEIKAAATTSTSILRYTRWQVTLGTATTVTFVMSLVRG